MRSYNGIVTLVEASNSMADRLVGMVKPRPPSLGGKDRSSRSRSPGGALPVRDGIRSYYVFNGGKKRAYVWNGPGKVSPLVNHTVSEGCKDRIHARLFQPNEPFRLMYVGCLACASQLHRICNEDIIVVIGMRDSVPAKITDALCIGSLQIWIHH